MGKRDTTYEFFFKSEQVNCFLQQVAENLAPGNGDILRSLLPWKPHRDRYYEAGMIDKVGMGIAGLNAHTFCWEFDMGYVRPKSRRDNLWEPPPEPNILLEAELEVGHSWSVFTLDFPPPDLCYLPSDWPEVERMLIEICRFSNTSTLIRDEAYLIYPETKTTRIEYRLDDEFIIYTDGEMAMRDIDAYATAVLDQVLVDNKTVEADR